MKAICFPGVNLRLLPPDDWDEARHGPCATIYGYRNDRTVSAVWQPTDEERAQIAAGQNVVVTVPGRTIQAMALSVADIPEMQFPDH